MSFLVQPFVFPGLDSCLIFSFALFSMNSSLILPQTLQQQNYELLTVQQTGHGPSAPSVRAGFFTCNHVPWRGESRWREFVWRWREVPMPQPCSWSESKQPLLEQDSWGPGRSSFKKKWSWWFFWHICCITRSFIVLLESLGQDYIFVHRKQRQLKVRQLLTTRITKSWTRKEIKS